MHDSETSFWVRFDDQNQEKEEEEHDKGVVQKMEGP